MFYSVFSVNIFGPNQIVTSTYYFHLNISESKPRLYSDEVRTENFHFHT